MKRATVSHDFVQQAWVVNDLQSAMRHWIEVCGVGPFFVLEHPQLGDLRYRGHASTCDFSAGVAQAGRTQIELIVQHCYTPSVYRDFVPKGTEAFHHMAVICSDYDAEVAHYVARGAPVITSGIFGDLRFCYVDATSTVGFVVELLEDLPTIHSFFGMVADAAVNWDGSNPIRPVA